MDFLEQCSEPEELADGYLKFRAIKAHQGPLNPEHPDYKGSSCNLLVEWETGEIAFESLTQMSIDDPVSCAEYGKKHSLVCWLEETQKICQDIQQIDQSNQVVKTPSS